MTPRPYELRARKASTEATRERIRAAALELYGSRGVSGTTIQAVAERADVARGTVVNHFRTPERLLEAVLDKVVADLRYPDVHLLDGATTAAERIRLYVDAMFRFYVRSEAWWPAFAGDMDLPVMKAREQEFYAVVGRLFAASFGDLAGDRIVGAAARAYVSYMPLHDLRAASLSLDEAIEVVATSLIDLVERRRAANGKLASEEVR